MGPRLLVIGTTGHVDGELCLDQRLGGPRAKKKPGTTVRIVPVRQRTHCATSV